MSDIKEVKVNVDELKIGMYVSRLDRPWLETQFMLQGFRINDDADLQELRRTCAYVYIDEESSEVPLHDLSSASRVSPHMETLHRDSLPKAQTSEHADGNKQPHYVETVPMEEELKQATRISSEATEVVHEVFDSLRSGGKVDFKVLEGAVKPMIDSVLRNPDAFIWLSLLKKKGAYTYHHSLSASVYAAAFGRQLGLSREALDKLSLGALLFDIGKSRLPSNLLNKQSRLTPQEFELMKKHVVVGVKLLMDSGRFGRSIVEMVATHHERFNGEGYPRGLKGDEIPLFGRIAAIVDCFDAITSQRSYAKAMSAAEAVHKLYEWRNVEFQGELVEQFIQAIGIFPAGTLVELTSGEVGVIIAQNRVRRLRPRVMLILNALKRRLKEFPIVDLMNTLEDQQGNPLDISNTLPPGSYGIDPVELFL